MRKGIIKIVVLLLVSVATVIGMSLFNQQSQVDLTSKMASATLPVVYLERKNVRINELYGYRQEMDGTAMRDTITPLCEDLTLPVVIRTYQNQIEGISYEVRSMDMQRLIEDGEISSFSQTNGEVKVELQFENILEEDMEYVLVLRVNSDGKPVYYYTRIIREKDYYTGESLDFVMKFHAQTFDKAQAENLATYLEPDGKADNTTLQQVTIHSSLSQVSWGDFRGERLEEPVPSIKEMGSSYNTIVLRYVVTAAGDNGEVEYYNVTEYYRVRYNSINSRMYLLNYERNMNQIFRGENGIVDKNRLLLGIASANVKYKANEKGNIISFVQEGELWLYNNDSHELSQVFSFLDPEGISERENNGQHEIQIMRIDENGSMDFVVYGYMNRGHHEGQTGIGVYHYDSLGNTVEEEIFLPSNRSFEMLKADWGQIFYASDGNIFYLLADGKLFKIDLSSRKAEIVIPNLIAGSYAVSQDGRYIAWQEGEEKLAQTLKIMDLEGEEVRSIKGSKAEYLKPVGFVESDFVYGTVRESDVAADYAGNSRFPMYKITIVDKNSKIIKEYQKEGFYISHAYVEQDTIFLNRETQTEHGWVTAEQDTIKNQQLVTNRLITVDTMVTEKKQTQVLLVLPDAEAEPARNPQVKVPREVVLEEEREVELQTDRQEENYYIYSGGKILMSTSSVTEAVIRADENMGVVVGAQQKYIWRRGRKTSRPTIGTGTVDTLGISENSVVRSLTYLLKTEGLNIDVEDLLAKGETPREILTEALAGQKVLDLSGCSVSQVLYYVSLGTPVLAMAGQEAVLIVGYDEHNTILYRPVENEVRKMGLQDSDAFFASTGNIFLGYIK
ncbi:hypothetical protein D3Z36_04455 [Lachnospiraceae bacterium]|nr:hypothetical protein [Lachnospiraceae bacterium]